ncbi:MAG TPA: hypothetical protein VGR63_02470 [Casimicrobiaceae bacterium]|jgi:hypothetical protein|nr:hypothetical protein [Casimicrobiaceae bacterium]
MPSDPRVATAQAIEAALISPNETDRNGEAANVVDGLFAIARSLDGVANALRYFTNSVVTDKLDGALRGLAALEFVPHVADAIRELEITCPLVTEGAPE